MDNDTNPDNNNDSKIKCIFSFKFSASYSDKNIIAKNNRKNIKHGIPKNNVNIFLKSLNYF